ncbi:sperm-associated antigen 17-like [Cottoperca gobio]|uniref:Sperm-associated antigen 17-like n=1 Tax=Cottoperca gobio TaxID=56716 RepID=A0A6J2RLU5_COTGO|nr:sperm-associated antigen 17-like [Cottoperca gobio]
MRESCVTECKCHQKQLKGSQTKSPTLLEPQLSVRTGRLDSPEHRLKRSHGKPVCPSPVGPSKEKKTKLKRRDDVEPPKFIDDEPQDGPQHYVLILGFFQPHLIGALDAIGVHVDNVIKLCSEGQQENPPCGGHEQSLSAPPILDAEAEVHGHVELALQARKLDVFWSGLRPVLDSRPHESKLHDVVQLSYTVPGLWPAFQTQDPEAQLEMGSRIFEGVANLIYDCLDWRRQYQRYLDNIQLFIVPTVLLDPQPTEFKTQRYSLTLIISLDIAPSPGVFVSSYNGPNKLS